MDVSGVKRDVFLGERDVSGVSGMDSLLCFIGLLYVCHS